MKKRHLLFILQAALIAAIYTTLTLFVHPFGYNVIQVRLSEALTVLPFFTPAAIPGLAIGCLLSNTLGPFGLLDMIVGTLATTLAAILSYLLRGKPYLVPLPPVICNAIIIGIMLKYAFSVPFPLFVIIGSVGLGQAITCYGIGYPLLLSLKKYSHIFKLKD